MAASSSLLKLSLGTLRDEGIRKRHQSVTMANMERKRSARRLCRLSSGDSAISSAAVPSAVATPLSPTRVSGALMERISSIEGTISSVIEETTTVFDWAAEAARISESHADSATRSAAASAGAGTQAAPSPSPPCTYSVKNLSLWVKSTHEEKLRVISAFKANRVYSSVMMANCALSDVEGAAWGRVLACNTTSERLLKIEVRWLPTQPLTITCVGDDLWCTRLSRRYSHEPQS